MITHLQARHAAAPLILLVALAPGCAKPSGPIFEPLPTPLLWPAPPEQPRIRYVGQLETSADLKPAIPLGQRIGQALFGKKPVHALVTPYALCTDDADRLFVTDTGAQLLHVFNLKTRKYEQWQPGAGELRFGQPVGVAYDPSGRLLVADSLAACIYIFDASGKYLGLMGDGELIRPVGIAFDRRTGRTFIADTGAHQVVILASDGELVARLGGRGTEPGQFNYPTNVAIDSQNRLYVSDSLNFRIQQFSPDLEPLRLIGRLGDLPGYFSQPKGIALDTEDHLYAVDAQFEAVQIFDADGSLLLDFGQEGRRPGEFWLPSGIFIDSRNRIWVADSYNRRVQVFDYLPERQP